jgi:hypothetical protein
LPGMREQEGNRKEVPTLLNAGSMP